MGKVSSSAQVPDVNALLLRGVEALEVIARELGTIRVRLDESGVPGSPFERANRALGRVKTVVGAVRLWARVRDLLGPSEGEAFLGALVKVASGLTRLPQSSNAAEWTRDVIVSGNERAARAADEKRAGENK